MNARSKRDELRSALQSREPDEVASVLQIPPIVTHANPMAVRPCSETLEDGGQDWSSVVCHWIDACNYALAGNVNKCYESQAALHAAFNQVFANSSGNWLVPALHTICQTTHRIAKAADTANHAKLENAASLLQESFGRTYNDRKELQPNAGYNDENGSKKAGVLFIVNQLFAIYFRLNTLRLCKNLVKPVQARQLQNSGSMGQRVTYRYYVGRLLLFEDQYDEAVSNLEYALCNCHKDASRNKRRILQYLVPVKLYRGVLPTPELLKKYRLALYEPLVTALRQGNLRLFNDTLIKYQDTLIRQGTYLLLEKCKTVCYRNLFRRIHFVQPVAAEVHRYQISLELVVSSLKWLNVHMDLDEVECILANLIYRGYVRGYLSHTKRMLVLSKRDPFPLSAVLIK